MSSHSRTGIRSQSNKMIRIKTAVFLDIEGGAGREISTGRDEGRHTSTQNEPARIPQSQSLRITTHPSLIEVFMHPLFPHNPACPMSPSLHCSGPPSGIPFILSIT